MVHADAGVFIIGASLRSQPVLDMFWVVVHNCPRWLVGKTGTMTHVLPSQEKTKYLSTQGTPEKVAQSRDSITARYLRQALGCANGGNGAGSPKRNGRG